MASELKEFSHFDQGTPLWFEARCGIVTASMIGNLITAKTLKPADNETSRGVIETLVTERLTGRVEHIVENRDMQRGTLSEPYARDVYAEHYKVDVKEVGFYRRDEDGWRLGYSPDGVVGEDGLIEIKSPKAKNHLRTILNDEVPAMYVPQVQTGLYVTGREWIDFVSYNAGMPLYVKRVEPDERWHEAIAATVAAVESQVEAITSRYLEAVEGRPKTEYVDVFGEDLEVW